MIRDWRRSVAACLLLCAAIGSIVRAADAPKSDRDRLQGKWVLVSGEANGQPFSKTMLERRFTVVVSGDKWDQFIGNDSTPDRWSFTIDPSKSPKQINFTDLSPEATGDEKQIVGIYEIDGDKLRLCSRKPGAKDRPADFKSGERSNVIRVYERAK